ncbi:MAG TPA: hypothetical protein VG650_17825 [Mycobacteriales bacterium]|nr:hypothetical protein [Mycobacteriales bacterium]
MRGLTIRSCAAVAAVVALAAGCGSSSSGGNKPSSATPASELASSVHALGDAQTLDLSFALGASGADLLQIGSGLGAGPTKAQADAISNDHIAIELQAPSGKTLRDNGPGTTAGGGAFALTLGDAHRDYFSLESVGGSLYARIDLHYFLGLVNGAPSFNRLSRQVAGAPTFVRDALAGKWISVPAATLKSLSGLAHGQAGATPSAGKFLSLSNKVLTTFLNDLTVTRIASGSTDHLGLDFRLRSAISDEYAAVSPMLSALIPGGSGLPALHPANIPDVAVHLDAYVTNGALSKLVLDAGQFDTHEHISVPIELNISQQGPTITAPGGATPVDLTSIGQLLGGA